MGKKEKTDGVEEAVEPTTEVQPTETVEPTPAEPVEPQVPSVEAPVEPTTEEKPAKSSKKKKQEDEEEESVPNAEPANKAVVEAIEVGLKPNQSWKVINGKLHVEVVCPNGTTRLLDDKVF